MSLDHDVAIVCPHCRAAVALRAVVVGQAPDAKPPPRPIEAALAQIKGVAVAFRQDGQIDRAEGLEMALDMLSTEPTVREPKRRVPAILEPPKASKPTLAKTNGAPAAPASPGLAPLTATERAILVVLKRLGGAWSIGAVLISARLRPGGHVNAALASLRRSGFIDGPSSALTLTSEGSETVGPVDALPRKGAKVFDAWITELGPGSTAARILDAIRNNPNADLDGILTAAELNAGGHVNAALATLRKLRLVTERGLHLSEELSRIMKGA